MKYAVKSICNNNQLQGEALSRRLPHTMHHPCARKAQTNALLNMRPARYVNNLEQSTFVTTTTTSITADCLNLA
jgi:hypothetical protein